MDREAKKEGFRKYLESSGVLDTLTKALVALYEENDKPSSAVENWVVHRFPTMKSSKPRSWICN
uniref:Uncharacterized protein n=2 Tax=Triticinae TaxID=1648030 RepID=A0A453D743_AEGTS